MWKVIPCFPRRAGVGSYREKMPTDASLGLEVNMAGRMSDQIFTRPLSYPGHSLCWPWTCEQFGSFCGDRGVVTRQTDASCLTYKVVLESPK